MNTLDAIAGRRSIRKFKDIPLPDDAVRQILQAGILAPSGSNRQPWRFYIVGVGQRDRMLQILHAGIERHKQENLSVGSSENSARIMSEAPVTVFVFNPLLENTDLWAKSAPPLRNVVDVQSVGAAIQNMNLAAHAMGIGALWICDVFYAYEELCAWLGETHQMVAAVSFGYANEAPAPRPRKPLDEVATWL